MASRNLYRQNSSTNAGRRLTIGLLVGALVLLLLQLFSANSGLFNQLRGNLDDAVVQSSLQDTSSMPRNVADLKSYVKTLEVELTELQNWRLIAKSQRQKLNAYERILNAQNKTPFKDAITAHIVTETKGPFAFTYLANAGADRAITLNSIAINDFGLVGRIINVGQTSSRILLVRDFNSRVPVYGGTSGSQAILYGGHESPARLRDIPDEAVFQEGEEIFTSGIGGLFPRGLLVGRVLPNGNNTRVKLAMLASNTGQVQIISALPRLTLEQDADLGGNAAPPNIVDVQGTRNAQNPSGAE